jgi:hypothetical protein
MLGPHHLLKEPLCRENIAFRAEHEFDCTALLIHGTVQIFTRLTDLDVSLVHSIGSAAHLQVLTNAFISSTFRGLGGRVMSGVRPFINRQGDLKPLKLHRLRIIIEGEHAG